MLLFSTLFTDPVLSFKAPKGKLFMVESVHFQGLGSATANFLFLVARRIETDKISTVDRDTDFLASFETSNTSSVSQIIGINHKTKFLSLVPSASSNVTVAVAVYGKFVSASLFDILIEIVRNGR